MRIENRYFWIGLALTCFVVAPGMVGADETPVWKQFVEAKKSGKEPVLPDFSYAGYHRGEWAIPDIGGPFFKVTDYGAVPDDGKDDQAAIQRAIDDASSSGRGVVLFPPGRFVVNSDRDKMRSLTLSKSHIVLRGSGCGKGGTVLYMKHHRDPTDPKKMYSTPFHFVIGGSKKDSDLAKVVADARRESSTLTVDRPEKLAAGMWVQLLLKSVPAVKTYLDPYKPRAEWSRLFTTGVQFQEIHQVRSVEGNRVTFEEPIRVNLKAEHGWKLRSWSHLEEIGVEDICFMGGWKGPFKHHRSALHDSGWSGLQLRRLAHSWVRRCSFVGWNQAMMLTECTSSSVLQIRLEGAKGHGSIYVRHGGDGVLVGLVKDASGHHHGPSVGYRTSGVVFWRYEMHPDQPIDSHSGTPVATLLDRVEGGRLRGSGGPIEGLPNHLSHYVVWNFNHRARGRTYNFWGPFGRDSFVKPILVGLHGKAVKVKPSTVQLNESPGKRVQPESLYEAQLVHRLGKLPDWIARNRVQWKRGSREAMPTQDPPKKIGQVPDTARPKGYSAVTGPVQQDVYPKAVSSPYRLPWPGGVAWQCIQGNRGIVSHKGPTRFSYDFGMPVGSHVCAARAGTVVTVIDSHTGRGFSAPNNKVGIRHEDGTIGWYLHLEQGGSLVRVGEAVERGQEIARSGNVGLSLVPHLHFHVSRGNRATIPVTFRDASVRVDEGIPRMFRRYVSENTPPKR